MKKKKINSEIFERSIEEAKRWMTLSEDAAHDVEHIKSVTKNAVRIATAMGYENIQLIKLICWWHDVGRLFGPIHEELGGQIAKYNLLGHGCDEETAEIVYKAIRSHKWTMEPETIEGNILRDADKLDFISIKRWKNCIKQKQPEHIFPMIKLIPNLRIIVKLEPSKALYDTLIKKFRTYVKAEKMPFANNL